MQEPTTRNDWNLDFRRPTRLGVAGAVAGATAGAAFLATGGPWLTAGGSLPLLGLTALWLRKGCQRRGDEQVEGFLRMLESRDRYTASHCSRVAAFADLIAEEVGLRSQRRLLHLRVAALLHDLGKMDVSLEILHKPGKLDEEEWTEMRGHVQAGCRRASSTRRAICRIIAQHHERPDGRGYPRQLRGREICLEARIVAVADAFDAMTSDRPYRRALDPEVALSELVRSSCGDSGGQQFDREVVRALERRFAEARALCTPQRAAHASPAA